MRQLRGRKGFRAISPKMQLRKVGALLPADIADWLYEKAEREGKSLSLLLTEILSSYRSKQEPS